MRDIKFRAWLYGDLIKSVAVGFHPKNSHGAVSDAYLMHDDMEAEAIGDHEDLIIEQFTGLQDKKGRDIYEGDIVSLEDGSAMCPITFSDGSFQMIMHSTQGRSQVTQDRLKRFYIIGNIHENGGLLDE